MWPAISVCKSVIPVEVISSVAAPGLNNKIELTVWPNPASERVTFTLQNIQLKNSDNPELLIYSATGRIAHRSLPRYRTANKVNYEIIPSLPSGIYIGAVQTSRGVVTQKLVIP